MRGRFVIRRARGIFWVLFAINALNYLDRLIAVAVGPTLKTEFHLSDGDIGLLGSAFLLVYTLAALPAGALADRLGARAKVIAVGMAIWSVFSGLTAFVRGYGGLFATRALVGVGEASYSPAGVALLVSYYPRERRAGVIGRWQAAQVVGTLLAFLIAGALFVWLPAHLAWRVAFLITAAPGLALAALAWRMADHPSDQPTTPAPSVARRATLAEEVRTLARQTQQTLRIPMIWVVVALQAVVYIVITPSVTFLRIYVRAARGPFHMTAAHASFALGLTLVAGGVLGTILGGVLSDWLNRWLPGGRVLAVTVGFVAAIPCYCVMLLAHSLAVFLVAAALTTLTLNLPAAALTATPQDVAPPHLRATAIAVMMLLSHLLGDIWASWAVGALAIRLGDHLAQALLYVGAPALVVGCLVSVFGAWVYARSRSAIA
jgi:sugar phosphate permease